MISPREIEATARAYNTKAEIIPDVAHNSMLEQNWRSVADRILAWLNEHQAANTTVQAAELKEVTPYENSSLPAAWFGKKMDPQKTDLKRPVF
jgi:hypothetical protein